MDRSKEVLGELTRNVFALSRSGRRELRTEARAYRQQLNALEPAALFATNTVAMFERADLDRMAHFFRAEAVLVPPMGPKALDDALAPLRQTERLPAYLAMEHLFDAFRGHGHDALFGLFSFCAYWHHLAPFEFLHTLYDDTVLVGGMLLLIYSGDAALERGAAREAWVDRLAAAGPVAASIVLAPEQATGASVDEALALLVRHSGAGSRNDDVD